MKNETIIIAAIIGVVLATALMLCFRYEFKKMAYENALKLEAIKSNQCVVYVD